MHLVLVIATPIGVGQVMQSYADLTGYDFVALSQPNIE